MDPRRLLRLLPLALIALGLSGFAGTRYRAGVHPLVEKQLDYATSAARAGRESEALAYMQALLIGDEIKVAVLFEPESEPQRSLAEKALDAAGEAWSQALDGKVRMRRVEPGETPDLVIHFQPDVQFNGRPVSGYIRWTRDVQRDGDRWKGTFNGQVYARTQLRGKPMTFELMRNCLGHEMGHMFGLPDADGDEAIMGPLNVSHPIAKPNDAEVETVRAIRADTQAIRPLTNAFTGAEHQILVIPLEGPEAHCK